MRTTLLTNYFGVQLCLLEKKNFELGFIVDTDTIPGDIYLGQSNYQALLCLLVFFYLRT